MIVLDTNVLSEALKPSPAEAVLGWLAARPRSELFTTSITQGELLFGVAILPKGKRRAALQVAIEGILEMDFAGQVLPFDSEAARHFAEIAAARRARGRPIAELDAQIAAIARSRRATLATRDTRGFADCGVTLVDPWKGA